MLPQTAEQTAAERQRRGSRQDSCNSRGSTDAKARAAGQQSGLARAASRSAICAISRFV